MTFGTIGRMFKQAVIDWLVDRASSFAAAIAFYAIFSLVPLVTISISVGSMVYGRPAASAAIRHLLRLYVGGRGAALLTDILSGAAESGQSFWAFVFSMAALLLGATSIFSQIQQALNTVWKVPDLNQSIRWQVLHYFRRRLLAFGMVAVFGLLLFVSISLGAAWGWMRPHISDAPMVHALHLYRLYSLAGSFAIGAVMLAMIYKILPDARIGWGDVWLGAVATSAALVASESLINLYLSNAPLATAYGAAGSLVVVLLWVYFSAMIFLLGAEFTHVYAGRKRIGVQRDASGS